LKILIKSKYFIYLFIIDENRLVGAKKNNLRSKSRQKRRKRGDYLMWLRGIRTFSIFRCFFEMHLNDFYEFGSIKPNSKKHRNIEKIRFGSIELIRTNSIEFSSIRFGSIQFDSFRYSRKVLEFYCSSLLLLSIYIYTNIYYLVI